MQLWLAARARSLGIADRRHQALGGAIDGAEGLSRGRRPGDGRPRPGQLGRAAAALAAGQGSHRMSHAGTASKRP